MEYIIGPVWIFLELIAVIMFSSSFLKKRETGKRGTICLLAIWVVSSVYTNLGIATSFSLLFNICTTFLLLSVCFQGKWLYRLLCAVLGHLYLGTIDVAITYGTCVLLGMSYDDFVWKKLLYTAVVTSGKLLNILLVYLVLRFRGEGKKHAIKNRWTILTVLFPAISLLMLFTMFFLGQNDDDLSVSVFVFCSVLAVGNVAILYLIRIMENRSRDEHQIALMDQQMEIQTQNIISLEKSYRTQRQASHEFNHKLQVIAQLLSQKEYGEAESYIHEIQSDFSLRTFAVNSRHPILDAIFNQKYQSAKEQDIEMMFSLNDLSEVKLKANYLVVLFSNLLDNAIEASTKCEGEKIIRCCIEKTTCLYISIRNTSLPVSIVDNQIETTKVSRHEHGYGLRNVCRILEELHSEYSFGYSDGWFQFVAEIPLSNDVNN